MKQHPPSPLPYSQPPPVDHTADYLRLEGVTICVGFDDMLDVTLAHNHAHFDTMIVVTSHTDRKTHSCAKKHGATCVQTDNFSKNGRKFNKGAAINAGFNYFQYHGWRMHLDSDIVLPDNFRRILFNYTHLEPDWLYGADRVDVIGKDNLHATRRQPQHTHNAFMTPSHYSPISPRYMDALHGWLPLGFFQLWHASCQKPYPYSLGTAAHDDISFSALWPRNRRQLLPGLVTHHLCSEPPTLGQNWDGNRRMPRL
jgi:hypothetical protein